MTPAEAARILEVAPDATPEQLEARFLELRRKLEDKIAKAPTPGLQAKYRESLTQITTAFEMLVLAADSSTLPMLSKPAAAAVDPGSKAGPAAPAATAQRVPEGAKKKKSSSEFAAVALIAVVLLGGGGWYVMKTRAEQAEQARLAAEAKLAAEVKAAQEAAAAAALAAERARRASQLRTELATSKVAWEALENRLREAERRTSEAKSEFRSFRDGPAWKKAELSAMAHRQELFSSWLNEHMAQHPAKIERARAEQLLSDNLLDEAAEAVEGMRAEIELLQANLPSIASAVIEDTGQATIRSKPKGIKFVFTDSYGRSTEGVTPAKLEALPLSNVVDPRYYGDAGGDGVRVGEFTVEPSVRFIRQGWKDVVASGRSSFTDWEFDAEFPEGSLTISSTPSGIPFTATNELGWQVTGKTPATVPGIPPGRVQVTLSRAGFGNVSRSFDVEAGKVLAPAPIDQRSQELQIAVAEAKAKIFVDGKLVGSGAASVTDLAPGEHKLQLELEGYPPYRGMFAIKQEATSLAKKLSFQQLAQQIYLCGDCHESKGVDYSSHTCTECGGAGGKDCNACPDYYSTRECVRCRYTGWQTCAPCWGKGTVITTSACRTCNGDGKRSRLEFDHDPT